jgi:hypothetical protein
MGKGGPDADRMIWTTDQIADAVWTHATRTIDGLAPAASDGSALDNIAYAVWTYGTRTVEGGTGFSFVVAESMPTPSQASALQTVMPVVVSELTLTPEQAVIVGTSINVIVDETLLTPAQSILAETSGGTKKKDGGAWSYYPPIYTIRTKGSQEAPAPGERIRAKFNRAPKPAPAVVIQANPAFVSQGRQDAPTPYQTARVKSHREVKARNREESDILALLASL